MRKSAKSAKARTRRMTISTTSIANAKSANCTGRRPSCGAPRHFCATDDARASERFGSECQGAPERHAPAVELPRTRILNPARHDTRYDRFVCQVGTIHEYFEIAVDGIPRVKIQNRARVGVEQCGGSVGQIAGIGAQETVAAIQGERGGKAVLLVYQVSVVGSRSQARE